MVLATSQQNASAYAFSDYLGALPNPRIGRCGPGLNDDSRIGEPMLSLSTVRPI